MVYCVMSGREKRMKQLWVLISLLILLMGTACESGSKLFSQEEIEGKFPDTRPGYVQLAGKKIGFQKAVFDYDDKAIMYVKEYVDPQFVEYKPAKELEIYVVEFEDFTTKYKKVDEASFRKHIADYASKPFRVKTDGSECLAIVEIYVP
jgi:hypothetical protein